MDGQQGFYFPFCRQVFELNAPLIYKAILRGRRILMQVRRAVPDETCLFGLTKYFLLKINAADCHRGPVTPFTAHLVGTEKIVLNFGTILIAGFFKKLTVK